MRTVSAHTDLLNTMFRHKGALINTSVVLLLLVNVQAQSNSRSYDTNDWIPVSRSCPTCFQNEDTQSDGVQKRPTGRVLNLPSPDQKRFFPPEQSDSSPQSYNIPLKQQEEKQQPQQQARLLQNQGQYPQPQIVLPPQLQSLINQGQPFLSPQKINNQLLQAPNGVAYQPTLQTVPQFALNSTQFNSRDVIQNINLGLYNQQSTKQQPQITQPQNIKPNGNSDREEVQLLYVPLENLRQRGQRQQIAFPNEQRLPTPQAYNQPTAQQYQPVQHKQAQLQNIQHDFVQQALQAQKLQEQFQHNVSPVPQQSFRRPYVPDPITHEPTSTPAPKKRKPHQPPLAVYMGTEGHSEIKLGDVLTLLKDAKTISVQDNIGPDAPQVFVGPSHLAPPDGYVKFDLPYLSSIESNRVERKVDQLPFFVAPLSYKAPPGYSKIPFPAPHVGSVVINHIQANSQEQTTTENVQHFLNQNLQETSSHTPYSSAEITTVRTRGRQRQPTRANYAASSVQSPVTPEIPYGPFPTKASPSAEQQHSVQESLISPNPYGPTQFVQSTTPSIFENPSSLPQQIFATKNRFSTPNSNYNVHNVQSIPERHNQFVQQVQQVQQEVESTEPTPLATTLSDVISDEKYTVLEQFPLPLSEKSSSNKYSQINVAQNTPQRVPNRQHSRGRPTENYYNDESKTETPLPLVSNEQYSNEQYFVEAPVKSPFLQNQQQIPVQQYVTQAVPTKEIPLEHYGQDAKKPTAQEPLVQHQYVPQEIPTTEIPLEHYGLHHQQQQQHIVQESPVQHYSAKSPHQDEVLANQQYSTEHTSAEYEKPVRQSRPHSRVRGKQHFTPEPYYREQYETPNVKETSTRHEPLLNQQVVQHQTSVYDSREQALPVSTQATRGRGRPEHTPETYFKEDYVSQNVNETPVHHEVALNKQVNEQSAEYVSQEIPLLKYQLQNTRGRDYDSQEISLQQVNPQVTRGRSKSEFTPEPYRQQYEQHSVEPTVPEVHVTRKPIVNYDIPIVSTQKSIELTERPQYDPETYYRVVSEQPRVQEQQQYTLPSQLPPISPHLPGLVNSLQDQAIRPLLAPLLLPPSEEPPVTEYTSEYYTTPFTTTSTTTTTTTTPVPIIETTTQFKRTRGRQRGTRPTASYEYVNTTPTSHQRTSSYRGRRPYTRTRQQPHEKNLPVSSTAQPEVVTETSTRAAFNRNRYAQRERQYVSPTEQPRRQPTNSRQRFRTRGRPLKTDEEYAVRSTTENVPDFKQPSFEGEVEAPLHVDHSNVELPVQIPTNNPQFNIQNDQFLNQKQKEQALVYVQNSNKQTVSESNPIQISSEEYIPRDHFISSTEVVEPLHQTTIAASAPENNIVSDVLHNEPVVLVNHQINQQQSNYPNVEFNTNRNVEYNSNEEINVNTSRVKYNEEPEVRVQPTTEIVRTRSRIRGRPRTRGYQSTSSRYQAPAPTTTTTTTQRTTTESNEENQEEFYGFFRPPSFVKPIKMEYKQSSELRPAVNPTPSVAYLHSPTSEEQNVYVSPVGNPVYSTPATHLHVSQVDDSEADHNIRTQYVSSTPDIRTQYAPRAESSEEEEEVVDIKPVTRRPSSSSFNRARHPVTSSKVEDHTEIPSPVTEKYYIVRPTKRPETQTPKVTRIRGRIRRPTRPTTVAPTTETENSYSGNQQQQHYSRTNELSNTHSDEYVAPVKTRQRITNRGKSHFQLPRNEKIALEPESNNYPPSFLQAQQNHHQQADATLNIPEISAQKSVNIMSAEEVHTAKPSFQLTIEPEDGDDEYSDQVPYTSVNKHRIDINLDEGAESKYSAKIVAKPSNYNFIVTNEKNNGNIEKTTEKPITTETIDITTVKNEPVVTEPEDPVVTFQQITTAFPEIDITQSSESTTTDVPTTLEPVTDTPQARRRGIWRLVKLRPVGDDFESAESQNIGTVFNNNFDAEKPVRKYHSVKRIRTTTEEAQEEITTVEPPKVVNNQQNDVPNPESDIFAPLYEMFGYTREGSILDNGFDILPSDDETVTTTVLPTVNNIFSDDVELTTLSNYNTTEINQDFSSIKEDKIEMYSDRLAKLGDKEAESSTEDSWRTRIIGTSTTTEVSHETEICYRGRCVKSSSEESSERL